MVADGRADRLEARWRDLTREQVYSLRTSVFFAGLLPGWLTLWALDSAGSLFDARPLRDMIASSLDLERIRSSPVHLLVVTTDLARRERRVGLDLLRAVTRAGEQIAGVDGVVLVRHADLRYGRRGGTS